MLFLLLLVLVHTVVSDCPINYNPKDIHSASFIASSSSSAGDAFINSLSSAYTYSLPTLFSVTPQVAVGIRYIYSATSNLESMLADGAYYYIMVKPSSKQLDFNITISNSALWQFFKVQLIVTSRSDMQLGYYSSTSLQNKQFQVALSKNISNGITIPFIAGLKINKLVSSNSLPCYFKITNTRINTRALIFSVDTNCLCEVNINYVVYDTVSLTKQYKVTQNNVRIGTSQISPLLLDVGTTNILGFNGFMTKFQPNFAFTSSFSNFLSLKVNSDFLIDISFAYFMVQNLPTQYCVNCHSGYIISDNYCVNNCPDSTITFSLQKIKICVTCDISKYRVSNEQRSACVCAVNYYLNSNTSQCIPCDVSCATCNGSLAMNCLSCDPENSVLSNGYCLLKSGFGNNVSQLAANNPIKPNASSNANLTQYPPILTPVVPNIPKVCGVNQQFKRDKCECVQGFFNISTKCTSCLSNQFFNGTQCSNCIDGQISIDKTSCYCPKDTFLISGKCQKCQNNSKSNGNQCICIFGFYKFQNYCLQQCPFNSNFNGKECLCVSGLVPFLQNCVSCPLGSVFLGNSCVCVDGQPYNSELNKCQGSGSLLSKSRVQVLPDRIKASIKLSPFPSQVKQNLSLVRNIVQVSVGSGSISRIDYDFKAPDCLQLSFISSSGQIKSFSAVLRINPMFKPFFPNNDISKQLVLSI